MDKDRAKECQAKADEIGNRLGCTVYPIVFQEKEDGEYIVGFLKHPSRIVQLRVMDKGILSPMTAASELLDICLIKEESDPRMYSESPQHDKIYLGACLAANDIIKYYTNQFKKK